MTTLRRIVARCLVLRYAVCLFLAFHVSRGASSSPSSCSSIAGSRHRSPWGLATPASQTCRLPEKSSHLIQALRAGSLEGSVDVDDEEEDGDVEDEEEDEEDETQGDDEEEEEEEEEDDDDEEDEDEEEEEKRGEVLASDTAKDATPSEHDEPLSLPFTTQMYMFLGVMLVSRRLDLTKPGVVRVIRFAFIAYVILQQVFLMYVRTRAKLKNDRTPITIKNPLSGIVNSQLKQQNNMMKDIASSLLTSQSSVMEYDLKQAQIMNGSLFTNVLMMSFVHFKMKQTQPLLLQTGMGFLTMVYSPLFQVYVMGRNLERPFKTPSMPPMSQTEGTETTKDAAASTEPTETKREMDEVEDIQDDEEDDDEDDEDEGAKETATKEEEEDVEQEEDDKEEEEEAAEETAVAEEKETKDDD